MLPPDASNSPESSEPCEEEFDREWAELKKLHPSLDPDRTPEEDEEDEDERDPIAASNALEAFIRRHPTRLRERGVTLEKFLEGTGAARDEFAEACEHEDKAHEAMLHAGANLAEAERNLVETIFHRARELEAMTDEQWQAMETEQRTACWNFLAEFRTRREEWLGKLPIEDRQRLEAEEK